MACTVWGWLLAREDWCEHVAAPVLLCCLQTWLRTSRLTSPPDWHPLIYIPCYIPLAFYPNKGYCARYQQRPNSISLAKTYMLNTNSFVFFCRSCQLRALWSVPFRRILDCLRWQSTMMGCHWELAHPLQVKYMSPRFYHSYKTNCRCPEELFKKSMVALALKYSLATWPWTTDSSKWARWSHTLEDSDWILKLKLVCLYIVYRKSRVNKQQHMHPLPRRNVLDWLWWATLSNNYRY